MRHKVITSQQIDGWRAICDCGWTYENTSPSVTVRAAELHGSATEADLLGIRLPPSRGVNVRYCRMTLWLIALVLAEVAVFWVVQTLPHQ